MGSRPAQVPRRDDGRNRASLISSCINFAAGLIGYYVRQAIIARQCAEPPTAVASTAVLDRCLRLETQERQPWAKKRTKAEAVGLTFPAQSARLGVTSSAATRSSARHPQPS